MAYSYQDAAPTYANAYLWPALKNTINARNWPDRRAFDLGCGNGATCKMLSSLGFDAFGVDPSESGIAMAQANGVRARLGSAYDNLASTYGTFPLVVSLEVIEHCIDPRSFAKTFISLIAPGGVGFLSTPYHSYLKNLALAVSGKMDRHFTALWDGGHIKFFSIKTLQELLREAGARDLQFLRIGRIPPLARSMVAIISVPSSRPSERGSTSGHSVARGADRGPVSKCNHVRLATKCRANIITTHPGQQIRFTFRSMLNSGGSYAQAR